MYLPRSQKRSVIAARAFALTEHVKAARIYPEEMWDRPNEFLFLFRESMSLEFEARGVPTDGALLWSMWSGYLESESGRRLSAFCERHLVDFSIAHASGHADVRDLQKLVDAMHPSRVVPIHTERGGDYAAIFPDAEIRSDGEWFDV